MMALEAYCQQTQRTKTDLLREMIRNLPNYASLPAYHNTSNQK